MIKRTPKKRGPTKTSPFGTNGRINHDSSEYYSRSMQPKSYKKASSDLVNEQILPTEIVNKIHCKTSENMSEIPNGSIHLMITSPPYNVGKEYDKDLSTEEYTSLIQKVLYETYRVLIDGGRAAVNVANLGRKPYIPLHRLIIELAYKANFEMRGEIIWNKSAGSGVSTAWGSWMSASNPTLRDIHEYILVFQKLPFGRKTSTKQPSTISKEQFLEYTKSVWSFPPQSAKKVSHPAPFPVELPKRLIQLYSFKGDVVLDPFMGVGSTAIAALGSDRKYIGYEISGKYVKLARQRINTFESDLLDQNLNSKNQLMGTFKSKKVSEESK